MYIFYKVWIFAPDCILSYVAKMQNPMKQNLLFHIKVVDVEKSGQAATGVPNEWWVPQDDGWHMMNN